MTTIAFIRHGVTNWNLERRAQGQSDIPLNEEGVLQAKALGSRFEGEQWDVIYSSDLARAHATALEIGEVLDLPVETDKRLRELSFGEIEGTNEAERVERWGKDWKDQDLKIEREEEILQRVKSFMKDIEDHHHGKRIIVVSHGAFLNDLFSYLLSEGYEKCRLDNTSVTVMERDDEAWKLRLHNCSKHLSNTP
ncbi:histidine phosphatase family protein [Pseudalkalibacillus sp. SCS-8]|uniref:histidine phosphatase family protein n=1 Tax=Pseudalkalibacillus nanhaiensis TaxID=3115291 RepID=UPI0032DA39B9